MAIRRKNKETNVKKVIISLFFAFIMISSILAIIFSGYNQTNDVEYNGFTFKLQGDYLVTKKDGNTIKIQSYPSGISGITVDEAVTQRLSSGYQLYISTPVLSANKEYAALAAYDLKEYLDSTGIQSGVVISDDNSINPNIPLINCQNASASLPVVLFEDSNQTAIALDGECIRISAATGYDFIAIKDRLVLKLSGIMP